MSPPPLHCRAVRAHEPPGEPSSYTGAPAGDEAGGSGQPEPAHRLDQKKSTPETSTHTSRAARAPDLGLAPHETPAPHSRTPHITTTLDNRLQGVRTEWAKPKKPKAQLRPASAIARIHVPEDPGSARAGYIPDAGLAPPRPRTEATRARRLPSRVALPELASLPKTP